MILPLLLALSSLVVTPERPISPPVLQAAAGNQTHPVAASDGNGFLAVWWSNGELVASRLDSSGTVLDRAPIELAATDLPRIDVAAGSDGYLVAYWDNAVRARRIDRDGRLSDPVILATPPRPVYSVTAAYAAGRFLVSWSEDATTSLPQKAALLDARGVPLGSALQLIDGAVEITGIAGGSGDFLAVGDLLDTSPVHPFPREVFAVRVGLDGRVSAPIILADDVVATTVRAVWTGTDYFAGWSTEGDVRGARIAADGSVTRTGPFAESALQLDALVNAGGRILATMHDATRVVAQPIAAGAVPHVVAQPWNLHVMTTSSAWDGRQMLVTYQTSAGVLGDIWGKLADAAGVPLDPETQRPGIAVALSPPAQVAPSVAASNAGSAVVWNEPLPEAGRQGLLMTFVLGDVTPEGRGIVVGDGNTYDPRRAAFSGTRLALTFGDQFPPAIGVGTLDALPSLRRVSFALFSGSADDVVWDGSAFLTAVSALRSAVGFPARQITVGRVSADGIGGATAPINDAASGTYPPSLASSGNGSLVVWVRNNALEAAVVTPSGTPSAVIPIAQGISGATVRWNGRAYVIAAITADQKGVRWFVVNAEGTLLTTSPLLPLATPAIDPFAVRPRSAALGAATTLVAWIDGNDIRGARISSDDGSLLEAPFVIATAKTPRYLDLDVEGDTVRVVYQAESPYPGVPHLTRVYTRTIASPEAVPPPNRRRAARF